MLGLYYNNAWGAKRFPFMSTSLFDGNGTRFNTTSILNMEGTIDQERLDAVGLPYMTATTVWGYFAANLAIGALITHVLIFYGKDMASRVEASTHQGPTRSALPSHAQVQRGPHVVVRDAFCALPCRRAGGQHRGRNHAAGMGIGGRAPRRSMHRPVLLLPLRPLRHRHRDQPAFQKWSPAPSTRAGRWPTSTLRAGRRTSLNSQAITWALAGQMYGAGGGRYVLVPPWACLSGRRCRFCIGPWARRGRGFGPGRSTRRLCRRMPDRCIMATRPGFGRPFAVGVLSQLWLRRKAAEDIQQVQLSHRRGIGRRIADCHICLVVCRLWRERSGAIRFLLGGGIRKAVLTIAFEQVSRFGCVHQMI
ncbi:peptide transporter MTD1, partial [Metarhizium majus ARSEF 297]